MIDFTQCEVNKFKAYGGANGNKIHIYYDGKGYMLKFPPAPGRNRAMSYTNGCISEYLGCHIYAALGIKVQDALLGNFDRHNGNWGILVDEEKRTAETAPVYDCGSCLYPQLGAEEMEGVLAREEEINRRIFVFPTSAVMEYGKKLSYFEYISSLKNPDCNEALQRIHGRIDMERINRIVEETPFIEPVQKVFYRIILKERKEKILDYSMERLRKQEQHKV